MRLENLYFVTGNIDKLKTATTMLAHYPVRVTQAVVSTYEIQSHSIEEVALSKARQSFEVLERPLFVTDAGWAISALNGFPGAYMRHINEWFSPSDFLDLMSGHLNREVILEEVIVYKDSVQARVFGHKTFGVVLDCITGSEVDLPSDRVISLTGDGSSIALEKKAGRFSSGSEHHLWMQFGSWLKASFLDRTE